MSEQFTAVGAVLGREAFAVVWDAGRAMSSKDAVALALALEEPSPGCA